MTSNPLRERLRAGLTALELPATDALSQRLLDYLTLLDKWNRVFNLTAVVNPREQISKHLLDSLAVAPYLLPGALLDVGSGGGLPGIPLAILEPERPVTLLDSNHKKTRFLQQAKLELGLGNVTVVNARAETPLANGPFDNVVCRAFGSLQEFVALTDHCLAPGGQWLAMKGDLPDDELKQIKSVEIHADSVPLSVPFLDATRYLIRLSRTRSPF